MRRGRSTGAPTKEESTRIVAAKEGPCMACLVGVEIGLIAPEHMVVGCDSNHFKSGNLRRAHKDGCALCLWHHHGSQQLHALGMGRREARERWGPSMFDEGKTFRATFGSDDDLIDRQTRYLAGITG